VYCGDHEAAAAGATHRSCPAVRCAVVGVCTGGAATATTTTTSRSWAVGRGRSSATARRSRPGRCIRLVKTGNGNTGLPIHDVLVDRTTPRERRVLRDPDRRRSGRRCRAENISVVNNRSCRNRVCGAPDSGWAIVPLAARPSSRTTCSTSSRQLPQRAFRLEPRCRGKPCATDSVGPANSMC